MHTISDFEFENYYPRRVINCSWSGRINIANRSVNAESWIDRSWLLPLALINLWILIVVATYSNKFEPDSKQIISPNSLLTN